MKIGQRGLDLICEFEGYHRALSDGSCVAYLDTLVRPALRSKGYKGLWTIGYGSTGEGITEGTRWTKAQAVEALRVHADEKAAEITKLLHVTVNQNQFDALVSAAYNLGTSTIKPIINLINEGDLDAAAQRFLKYDHAGGKKVKGLTRRRKAEKNLFTWEVQKEVLAISAPMKTSWYARITTALTSLVGLFSWQNLAEARNFMSDHAGMFLLGGAVFVIFLTKLFDKHLMDAFNRDEYVPAGTKPVEEFDE